MSASFPAQVVALVSKDMLIEWRTRARLSALVFFALATLLLFSFAVGPDVVALRKGAPGYLWLSLLFASVLSLGESFRIEGENGALEGLRLAPVDRRALFVAKGLSNALLLWFIGLVVLPVAVALFDLHIALGVPTLVGLMGLGCLGLSAPGVFYAAIASHARAKDVLLPLLLFPMLMPLLVASAKGTALILEGDPMGQLRSWVLLLSAFSLIYWALGFVLFPRIIDDN